jgi:hypothetical protein
MLPRAPTETARCKDVGHFYPWSKVKRVCCFVHTGGGRFHRGATCRCTCQALVLRVTAHVKCDPRMSTSLLRSLYDECPVCHRAFIHSIATASQGHHADGHPGNPREVWLDRHRAGPTGLNEALCAIEFTHTLACPPLATRLWPVLLPSEHKWAPELVRITALPVPLDAPAGRQG